MANQWNGKPLSIKVLGTNAGTSMDGLDIAHMHFTQEHPEAILKMELLHAGEVAFDGALKKRVMNLIKTNKTSPEEISIVNIQLGEFAADAVITFAKEQGFNLQEEVDIIAGQGQTIWHLPLPEMFEGDQVRAHLDMGEIAMIAAKTGITALSAFRVSDMALGRQGCPLFVAWDSLCATHPTMNRAVQNIGGIANITMLPAGDKQKGYDFDTGPGNVFIDGAMRFFTEGKQQYDRDGLWGAKGKVDQAVVDEMLAGPYFVHDIPKTTGRETFGDTWAEDICKAMLAKGATPEDCVATITRITAKSLADGYERWGPEGGIAEIYLGGGGSYNPNIINYLRERFPNTKIDFLDKIGIPTGSREAMSFGFKGLECIVGRSLIVPTHVESDKAGIIGQIQPGSGIQYHKLMKHVQDFWGEYPIEKRMNPVLEMEVVGRK
ncbi:Anhydro-N-acetylmuramic acid kinase [Pyronema domesticum]|uniref:Similar to Anhydro-N-acetylmuramic acid kinase acc. no. Q2JK57 n=1 Tax=Pyronema omphalodes (strain CBS 100304) TaxID=1076935 RepID=U4L088_PYROM|nr:Anhydro-N-acetylmuramic acid kinase [Pyronema domesticum]CCX05394.1 Similar to Anhydro-N-acetylmuramic acid kinase; acc. no. Q2JK57 [Pyronema omphalodes CBS 100304]